MTLRDAIIAGLRAPSDAANPVNVVGSIEERYAPAIERAVQAWLVGTDGPTLRLRPLRIGDWPQPKVDAIIRELNEAAEDAGEANTSGEILLRVRLNDGRFLEARLTADRRIG